MFMWYAAMAQQVERHLGKVEVTGSIPVGSFKDADKLDVLIVQK